MSHQRHCVGGSFIYYFHKCFSRWPDGECDWQTSWDVSRIKGWYKDDYLYAESALRARITRRNSQLGKEWLKRVVYEVNY